MPLVIGHKGAPRVEPENSVAAFAAAQRLGADGVELDVRRAQGGHLAVWHDPALADGRSLLGTPWEQLDGAVDPLDAVLDACAGLRLVNVEIKNWPADEDFDESLRVADTVVELLAGRSAEEQAAVVVSCFHRTTVARVRMRLDEVAPKVATGQLLSGVDDVARVVEVVAAAGHQAIHPHHLAVTEELVARAHSAGLRVNCWTCNDAERMRQLADIGTDGIITDEVELALATVRG